MSNPTDKSLLRCTLRKSADVFAKLVLYASYAVCGATAFALAVYGMLAVASVIADPIRIVITAMWGAIAFSGSLAATIPWYVYVGIVVVAAIPVYSLLWCIARELTEEDWDLGEIVKRDTTWYESIFIVILTLPYLTHRMISDKENIGEKYAKIAAFIGAYLHYRKRMKEERK